ncbi:DUF3267 domain-containing protein [Terrisporobacter petrolearius]|uniref:DUF3267 domain-containing protein n=1 Tax=Terrisporobacter petrolearius TaxID=1460447 RepID=UPI001D16C8B6|nr:DUF3267 domain-containing protein [Terrisporobacter petrolearius]MCC3863577.1 DUF3267 domain-containing protein [Terrisporobacter petrolearius]
MSESINEKNLNEQEKFKSFEKIKEEMIKNGYKENLGTISVIKANIYALFTAGPIALICFIIYIRKWGGIFLEFTPATILLFFISIILCIVIHEFLHGITWSLFCKNGFKSINFGVMWKSLTPYCHCKEPLNFKAYLTGGLMPLLILGILLFIVSFFTGNSLLMNLSMINILCAGGDTTIALLLCKYKDALFIDHPTDCGFIAFTK